MPVKLELGCGNSPTPGYVHHDRIRHAGHVDVACDLRDRPWPFVAGTRDGEPSVGVSDLPDRWRAYFKHKAEVDAAGYSLHLIPPQLFVPEDAFVDEILALDVFEHVSVDIAFWLDECWRLLKPGGTLEMRLPAWDHALSYRDPTHLRVFHPQTFDYWDPNNELHAAFGGIYFAETARWWAVHSVTRENNDLRYRLSKRGER